MCGIVAIFLTAYTIVGTGLTIIGTANGSTLPLIIFCALKFVLSCSLCTFKPKALPSSTLFFLLKTLIGESVIAFFMFSNVVYISSLVFKTLVSGFYGFSFDAQINIERFLPIPRQIDKYFSYPPYFP
jgi:hypothetical protein